MDLAQRVQLNTSKRNRQSRDLSIWLGYAVSAVVMVLAIYFAASSPGTAPGDFVSMAVFP